MENDLQAVESKTIPLADNPLLRLLFPVVVAALLGWIANSAAAISAAQKDQGDKLSEMKGQISVMAQQYSDIGTRLVKVEQNIDADRKNIGTIDGRVLVLESLRHH